MYVGYLEKSIKLIATAAPLSVKRSDKYNTQILAQVKLKKSIYLSYVPTLCIYNMRLFFTYFLNSNVLFFGEYW